MSMQLVHAGHAEQDRLQHTQKCDVVAPFVKLSADFRTVGSDQFGLFGVFGSDFSLCVIGCVNV